LNRGARATRPTARCNDPMRTFADRTSSKSKDRYPDFPLTVAQTRASPRTGRLVESSPTARQGLTRLVVDRLGDRSTLLHRQRLPLSVSVCDHPVTGGFRMVTRAPPVFARDVKPALGTLNPKVWRIGNVEIPCTMGRGANRNSSTLVLADGTAVAVDEICISGSHIQIVRLQCYTQSGVRRIRRTSANPSLRRDYHSDARSAWVRRAVLRTSARRGWLTIRAPSSRFFEGTRSNAKRC
jgi:hypothetical protein